MLLKEKIKRGVAIILATTLAISVAGCGGKKDPEPAQPADPSTAKEVPDYSDSTARMNMYAYISPTNGYFTNSAGQQIFTGDHRSIETYQEYKDCGFDTLLLLGNDGYNGEKFETSQLKKNLDMCQEVGLKCIVFDLRIHDFSATQDTLIGEGKQFSSQEELVAEVAKCMQPYKDHPAFYGISLFDEPRYNQLEAMGQTIRAIKAVKEDTFVHSVMLPLLESTTLDMLTGEQFGVATFDSYKTYIDTFLKLSQEDYVGYDSYPIKESGVLSSYFRNLQVAVDTAREYDADTYLTVQTCAITGNLKMPTEEEIRFQTSSALAFGMKNIIYFTYWMFPTRTLEQFTGAIMSDKGEKMLYDEVQRINQETQEMAKVLLHFDYEKAYITYDKETNIVAPIYFGAVESKELDNVKEVKVSQATIMTQLHDDEKDITGYMVMNASEPENAVSDEVSVKFEGYKFATIYRKGVPETVGLADGVLELTIDCGDCAFVIPHN